MAKPQGAFYVELGRRLRIARKNAGLSQDAVALSVRLSRVSIVNIEKGRQPVYAQTIVRLANVLGVALDDLLPPPDEGLGPEDTLTELEPAKRAWVAELSSLVLAREK